ncbi:cobalt-zinc-cadmium resistance protein CzcB [Roseomonas sp. TAS13]|uniref:hypothetical protein n=1 Tax=Roseomonas sp. TAS13 TaxID=1926319 RepID=UPI000962824A|nr:hypothetical protein [Roseomonas sp. TAS13]GAV37066.1 cobalt-zinc-cadmium resistance protein CzcB [Roseomonas sp. TAS13]
MLRMTLLAGAAIGGLALSVAYPSIPETARSLLGMQSTATGAARAAAPAAAPKGDGHGHAEGEEHGEEGRIKMTAEQVEAAGIRVAAVQGGVLVTRAAVPGVLAASQDRQARVTARLGGIVAEVRKTLGEEVARGDILAVLAVS